MARLLWVSTETPDRDGQGGQRRQFHQIVALLAGGHEITVLVPTDGQSDAGIREIVPVLRPRVAFRGRMLEGRIRRMRRLIASPEWDAVVVSHHDSAWLLPREGPQAPVLLDIHNVMSRWKRTAGRADEADAESARERAALRRAAAVMTCSETERRRLLEEHPEVADRAFAAPIGVDPLEWPERPWSRIEPRVALFGSWGWDPNRLGLEWFVQKVWPRLRGRMPEAIGLVAGTGVTDGDRWPAGIGYVGRVPDLASFTAQAAVVAVPVLEGVGASMKFSEALASGAAVIATPDGANSIDDPPAFVSDDPDAWAEWIADRLRRRTDAPTPDPARGFALSQLSWTSAVAPIEAWLRTVVANRGVPS